MGGWGDGVAGCGAPPAAQMESETQGLSAAWPVCACVRPAGCQPLPLLVGFPGSVVQSSPRPSHLVTCGYKLEGGCREDADMDSLLPC